MTPETASLDLLSGFPYKSLGQIPPPNLFNGSLSLRGCKEIKSICLAALEIQYRVLADEVFLSWTHSSWYTGTSLCASKTRLVSDCHEILCIWCSRSHESSASLRLGKKDCPQTESQYHKHEAPQTRETVCPYPHRYLPKIIGG
jgi:hypothetical protein